MSNLVYEKDGNEHQLPKKCKLTLSEKEGLMQGNVNTRTRDFLSGVLMFLLSPHVCSGRSGKADSEKSF